MEILLNNPLNLSFKYVKIHTALADKTNEVSNPRTVLSIRILG
jgi:hypothetical protein